MSRPLTRGACDAELLDVLWSSDSYIGGKAALGQTAAREGGGSVVVMVDFIFRTCNQLALWLPGGAPRPQSTAEQSGEDTDVDVVEVGASEARPSSRRRHSDEIARRHPPRCSPVSFHAGCGGGDRGRVQDVSAGNVGAGPVEVLDRSCTPLSSV